MKTAAQRRWVSTATAVAALVGAQALVQLAGAAPASAAVPGYQVVQATSAFDSTNFKFAQANCPAGKRVIGTGFHLLGAQGDIVLDDLIPSTSSVSVSATEDQDGTAAGWKITAIAVCANPLAGLTIAFGSSATGPATSRSATATCPAGRQVIGTGVALGNGNGQVAVSNLLVNTSSVTAFGFADQDGYANSWSIHPYAICASPLAGRTVVAASSAFDSTTSKIVSANCPAGRKATGQGWAFGSGGQTHINFAGIAEGGATQIVNEDDDGVANSWSVGTSVICATA